MKKLIATLLILLMVFSLVACKNDDPTIPSKPLKPLPTKPLPTNPTEPTTPTTNPDKPEQPDGRQEALEKIFAEGIFVVNSNSFKIAVGDIMDITVLTDTKGKGCFGVSGTIDGEAIDVTLYQYSDSIAYFHRFSNVEGQPIDKWYKCNTAPVDSENIFDTTESGITNVNDFLEALNQIEKIEYVESIDCLDYVDIYYSPTEEDGLMTMRIAIDSTTNEILNMSMTEDGTVTSIEFINCEDVSEYVELPEYIDDKMPLEEAATELTMTMLAIIMANADIS